MSSHRARPLASPFFASAEACRQSGWSPPADVYRVAHGWVIKLDLAGVRPDDVEVSALGRCLTVRGSRRDWLIEECQRSYSMEISYNRFERSIELPDSLDAARISLEYRDGMLLIRLATETGDE
jgi:HSP20 family protein